MNTIRTLIVTLLLEIFSVFFVHAQITIEECVHQAEVNYPIIKKYELLKATADIDLSEINKSWLPRISVYGQVTAQNIVPSFPDALTGVLDQMGQSVRGLGKIQYKAGADISQTVWDGGAARARREMVRTQEMVRRSSLDVELYAVRQRVESLFFAVLLIEDQIAQGEITYSLLIKNLEQLKSMHKNGIAMQSDVDMVEAQSLVVNQGLAQARSSVKGYRKVLELFIGSSLLGVTLVKPSAEILPTYDSDRPELRLFENRLAANNAAGRFSDTSVIPKIGLFAQAYYGYPGFDYFRSMMNRDMSLNIMAGVKVSWNIDSFYLKKNNARRTSVNALDIAVERELFLFNSSIQSASQSQVINGLRDVIKDDARIVALREKIRIVAESQLQNGIIDATALLTKISDENIAQLNASLHEIQLIKEIYKLKYILNR